MPTCTAKVVAADLIASLIEESFEQSQDEYAAEVAGASKVSGVQFSDRLRPVFVNGNPADVVPERYILFVGLNPKLDNKRTEMTAHYQALSAGPVENASVTIGYFTNTKLIPQMHSYFVKRTHVVRAWAMERGLPDLHSERDLLRRYALFCEFVPYHSAKTPGGLAGLDAFENVQRARTAMRTLIEQHPPAAIVLDGAATGQCLSADSPKRDLELSEATRLGRRRVSIFTHGGLPVVHCGFIGSISGVNSVAHREEVGRLLAR